MTKIIFYDVDTQHDFMNSNGTLYVPDAESIKPNLELLTRTACEKGIPVFGSVDRHFGTEEYKDKEGELAKYGGLFPEHCMDGTEGQKKISETTSIDLIGLTGIISLAFINNPLNGESANLKYGTIEKNLDERNISQIIETFFDEVHSLTIDKRNFWNRTIGGIFFEKQSYDVTTNPYFDKVMGAVQADVGIVYGVATDYCVKAAVKGLAKHVKQIYVVTDAIKGITPEGCEETFEEFKKLGVKFVTTKEVVEGAI